MLPAFLKMNIVLALLWLVYYLILRKLTFHPLNRWYFLFTISFSVAYPFLDFSFLFDPQQQKTLNQFTSAVSYPPADTTFAHWSPLITALLLTGSVIMLLRLVRQLVSLYIIHQQSVAGHLQQTAVQIIADNVNPFSFGRFIYINPTLHSPQEQEAILAHEAIHVKQWHTVDILLAELMLLVNWVNPAAWLMNRSIRENLEFITDHAILQKGFDRKQYQYSLLQVSGSSSAVSIAHEFTLKDIKRRIQMMNGRPSSRFQLLRYGLLPLLLVLFSLFAVKAKESGKDQSTTVRQRPESDTKDVATNKNNQGNQPTEVVVVGRRSTRREAQPAQAVPENQPAQTALPGGNESLSVDPSTERKNIRTVSGFPLPPAETDQPAVKVDEPSARSNGNHQEEPIIVTGYARPKPQQ